MLTPSGFVIRIGRMPEVNAVNWFTGVVLYILIWWVTLFAVLPIGTRPVERADQLTGWRGAPARPRIMFMVIVTTLASAVLWGGAYLLIRSDYISFRHGIFALPGEP